MNWKSMVPCLLACVVLTGAPAAAQEKGQDALPVRRVILYKHGVGYFERIGQVEGDAEVDMNFKAEDMSDLLKSLTVLDLGGGDVQTIAYDSTKTVEQQLGEYTFDLRNAKSLPEILMQMKGSEVTLSVADRPYAGRVLAVEKRTRVTKDGQEESYRLSLLLNQGVVKAWGLREINDLQFTDPRLQSELAKYLATLFSQHRRDEKTVTIRTTGEGARDLFAGYVQEQPVWKVSYRVVADEAGEALLQAWAIVDNVSGADWENVDLSLVSGLPVSFRQNLYDPHFVERPLIQLQRETAGAPVRYGGGRRLREKGSSADEKREMARMEAFDRSGAVPAGEAGAMADRLMAASAPRPDMMANMARQAARTVAQEAGALFVYKIDTPVTIRRDRSALLPIANSKIEANRVAIYNENNRRKNPMDGLRLTNTTGLTLEGGPMTVIEGDTYVGEALMDTLKPDEERYISFAVDLGTRVDPRYGSHSERITLVTIRDGVMIHHYKQRATKTYTIENIEDKVKTVVVEHPIRRGWNLIRPETPREKTDEVYRFEVEAPAKKTVKLEVVEEHPGTRTFQLRSLSDDQIALFLRQKYIDEATRAVLKKIVDLQAQIRDLQRENAELRTERDRIFKDQQRLRENLKSLGEGDMERNLRSRYITQWDRQEDRLQALRKSLEANHAKLRKLENELRKLIGNISFEKSL
jgi:hypothetical protein